MQKIYTKNTLCVYFKYKHVITNKNLKILTGIYISALSMWLHALTLQGCAPMNSLSSGLTCKAAGYQIIHIPAHISNLQRYSRPIK